MGYFVSRQHYFYNGTRVVEVEKNGLDYAGADMLGVNYRKLGEGKEYDDPREAINAAIAIRDAWRKDDQSEEDEEPIGIAVGTTGGMGMEIEATALTDDELKAWAETAWEGIPKCDDCGAIIEKKYHRHDDPDFGDFCSSNCVENAIDKENQRICMECGNEVPEGKKYFCSDECQEEHEEREGN